MKSFHSLVVLKRPRPELWTVMRDHLTDFAGQIADIEQVRQISRITAPDGLLHIVNEWRASRRAADALRSMLQVSELGWIDRNTWDTATGVCRWTIEPTFLGEQIVCSGQTEFAETMAGRGTRVTFSGELDLKPGLLASLGSMGPMLTGLVESVVTTIIPRNLRSVVEAAAAFPLPEQDTVVKT